MFLGYRSDAKKVALHEGESITPHSDGARRHRAPLEHGARWDMVIGESAYLVEMVYQQSRPGDDGLRLLWRVSKVPGEDGGEPIL